MASDLSEQHDIAQAHPEILEQVETILASARTDSPHWPVDLKAAAKVNPEAAARSH